MKACQQRIVVEARTWIGTRFRHQGRLKQTAEHAGGVDCLGLIIAVAAALGLEDKAGQPLSGFDEANYSKSPDGTYLQERLAALLEPIAPQAALPGDLGLFVWDANPQHLGIVSDYHASATGLIHAYAPARKVIEHRLDETWKRRIAAVFRAKTSIERQDACVM